MGASFLHRLLCGGVPEDFLKQNSEWIQEFLAKWLIKMNELMSMSPEEVDAQDFARARAIFARPLMLVCNEDLDSFGTHELKQAVEDMQLSVVTGLLYKRGSGQSQILQDLEFSLASHHFKTRKYNRGRDNVVAKLSTLSKEKDPANWNSRLSDLLSILNDLLPPDVPLGMDKYDDDESDTAQEPPPPIVRVF